VLFTVAATTSYAAGDAVRNNTGSGNHWTGTVCEVVDGTHFLGELLTGDYGTVTTSEGVENTTRSTTTTCSATSCPGILDNTTAGTAGAYISLVGTNVSWTPGTRAYVSGGTAAHVAIPFSATRDYRKYSWLQFDTASSQAMYAAHTYAVFLQCRFTGSSDVGLYNGSIRTNLIQCEFDYNTGDGCYNAEAGMRFKFCKFHHNGGAGCHMAYSYYSMMVGCWSYKNTGDGFRTGSSAYGNEFWSCVGHGNGGRGLYCVDSVHQNVVASRWTGNTAAGIDCTAYMQSSIEDYNYFQGNSTATVGIDTGGHSLTGTDTDYGYTDSANDDYSLASDATGANIAVSLDFAA